MEPRKVHQYSELYALYKFIEAMIFTEPQEQKEDVVPQEEYYSKPYKSQVTDVKCFINTYPGLLQTSQLRKYLREDEGGLIAEVGDKGEYRFVAMDMLEHIERHCRDPYVKRRAQRYMDEFHECD